MGRPLKQGVDWFPHDGHASDSRTITILENHFGHMGYAVWFKLLERISATETHIIGAETPENLEYLSAKLSVTPQQLTAILNKLAELQAIDPQLWDKAKIIWCQKLVDRLKPVYEKRNQPFATKPTLPTVSNCVSAPETPISATPCTISAPETPISATPCTISAPETPISATVSAAIRESRESRENKEEVEEEEKGPLLDKPLGDIVSCYENNISLVTSIVRDNLLLAMKEYPADWIKDAIKVAVEYEHRNWKYVERILARWKVEGRDNGKTSGHHAEGDWRTKSWKLPKPEEYEPSPNDGTQNATV